MKISHFILVCILVLSLNVLVGAAPTNTNNSLGIDITDMVDTGGVVRSATNSDTDPETTVEKEFTPGSADAKAAAEEAALAAKAVEEEKVKGAAKDDAAAALAAKAAADKRAEDDAEAAKLRELDAENTDATSSGEYDRIKALVATGGVTRTDAVPESFDGAKNAGLIEKQQREVNTDLGGDMDALISTGGVQQIEEIGPTTQGPGDSDIDTVRSGRESLPSMSENQMLASLRKDYDDGFIHTNILVTLRECIAMGLEKNLGLTIDRYDPSIAREGIRLSKSVFDPQFYGLARWSGSESPRPYEKQFITGDRKVVVGNSRSSQGNYSLGLSGRTITGIRYTFDASLSQSRTQGGGGFFNPLNNAAVDASIVVPLLKGFGIDVNLAPVRIARNNWRISKQQLSESVQILINDIIRRYFTLYYFREDAAAQEYTLQLAYELKAINEAKVQVGMAAPLEITQAEARIARDEETLIIAKNSILDAEDNLRIMINYNMDIFFRPKAFRPIRYHLVPLEKPQVYDIMLEEETLIDLALKNRETLEIVKLQYLNTRQNLTVAKNNLLPELNALGSLGYRGVGGNPGTARRDLTSGSHPTWSLGMEFNIPIFYNEPIATYRRAQYTTRQAEVNIELVQQQIAIEVRTTMRSVRTNRKRIDATRESTRLSREQLLAEQEKYNVGQSTTFQVLEYQEQLAVALSSEIRALADWRVSVADLARSTGTILDIHAVVIDDYYKRPEEEEPFITEYIWK